MSPPRHARPLPPYADVVVVGGGAIGTSIAFHLAEAGVASVVLVERDTLGAGSTCKAAGGVRAQFSDPLNIELGARSLRAFARFGHRPGQEIDLHRVGYLFCLSTEEDVAAFAASVELQNSMGVPSRLIGPEEAGRLCPLLRTDDLLAAAFSADDGYCSPEAVVLGYATAARRLGAQLHTNCAVVGIETVDRQVTAVVTTSGRVETPAVICAAGAWSAQVGALAGVDLPVTPLRRQIVVTGPIPGLPPTLPMTIDFATTFYFHREGPGMLLGMSDPDEEPGFRLETSDGWIERLAQAVDSRAPGLLEAGLATTWAGLYEMTPDHNALIGEAGSVSRLLYATGFSGHGFLQAPAVGEVLRDLYLGRSPVVEVGPLDAARFAGDGTRPEMHCV